MLKPIFRKMFPTVPGMSTEAGSSQNERQTTPPRIWRPGKSTKKKCDADLNTLPAPVHMEHAVSRPSRAYERDIEHQQPNADLWEDVDVSADDIRLPQDGRLAGT